MGAPLAAGAKALEPLTLNLERAFGGLVDAFGLAPLRDLQEAQRDLSLAAVAHRQAQVEYLEVAAGALSQGAEALTTRLVEMGQRGESVDSLLGLVRLWAQTTDGAMHRAMQTPRALEASAKLVRASARSRQQQQRVVAILSQALHMPTRAELDDAFREIQELKRELRRMRKSALATGTPGASSPRQGRARQGNGAQPVGGSRQASRRQPDRKGAVTR
jgi:class III poly(R)-hydroxyalkanoic acid synthase PhaE subunit